VWRVEGDCREHVMCNIDQLMRWGVGTDATDFCQYSSRLALLRPVQQSRLLSSTSPEAAVSSLDRAYTCCIDMIHAVT
jgi:hypothetical protein